jgi:hypothetical protein
MWRRLKALVQKEFIQLIRERREEGDAQTLLLVDGAS